MWEVIRAVRSAHAAEPELDSHGLLKLVSDNAGMTTHLVSIAVRYWAGYPDEVDAEIAAADAAEDSAEQAWLRERQLLAGYPDEARDAYREGYRRSSTPHARRVLALSALAAGESRTTIRTWLSTDVENAATLAMLESFGWSGPNVQADFAG